MKTVHSPAMRYSAPPIDVDAPVTLHYPTCPNCITKSGFSGVRPTVIRVPLISDPRTFSYYCPDCGKRYHEEFDGEGNVVLMRETGYDSFSSATKETLRMCDIIYEERSLLLTKDQTT